MVLPLLIVGVVLLVVAYFVFVPFLSGFLGAIGFFTSSWFLWAVALLLLFWLARKAGFIKWVNKVMS